ncbi:MAG TPA: methylmalonyl-CoA mutase family protein, partial [Gemmatimonadaceae bacterium]|nr:methylmalonyl-CoA mutase family protein [Gemmatimonadaceae bacterium]
RKDSDVKRSLATLADAAAGPRHQTSLMPLIIDAVRARATVGEISAQLASAWGLHRAPA